jgi:hypothetical protein
MRKLKFPKHLVVRQEHDETYFLIVGEPEDPARIDAEDGDRVAIYSLQQTKVFRTANRLEKR